MEKVAVEKAAVAEAAAGQIGLAIIRAALKLSFAENTLITATTLCRSPKKCAGLIPGLVPGLVLGLVRGPVQGHLS